MDKSDAARLMGMPESEIVDVAEDDAGVMVRTKDGALTAVTYTDEGAPVFTLLAVAGAQPPDDEEAEERDSPADADGAEPPVDGTAAEIVAWAGDDPARLQQALDAEEAKDHPRSTLVARLSASLGEPVRTTEG